MKKIAIHSVPRSGSSWLGEIINSSPVVSYSYQPLFSYEFKSALNENSSDNSIRSFFNAISKSDDDFLNQTSDRLEGKKPTFDKEPNIKAVAYKEVRYNHIIDNLISKTNDVKVVGLIRDPVEVINSWYHAPREFRKDLNWNLEVELYHAEKKNLGRPEEFFGLLKWIEVAQLFESIQQKYPQQFLLVKYCDLVNNRDFVVKNIFKFLDLNYTEQTENFLHGKFDVQGTYSVMKSSASKVSLSEDIICKIIAEVSRAGLSHYIDSKRYV